MRRYGLAVFALALVGLVAAVMLEVPAGAALQAGTPAASPAAAAASPAAAAASPVASPSAASNVVTLVAWYQQSSSGDFLSITPLSISANLTAGEAASSPNQMTGKADLSGGPNGEPIITLGESEFLGKLTNPDDSTSMFHWFYYGGVQGQRPATLVFQIVADKGPYTGYIGTATFISRESKPTKGILVIAIKPAS